MPLPEEACWARLASASRAVLGTVHPTRGVDAVPVVFALDDRRIVVPVDTVKPKRSTRLQRVANLERDPRCVVLVDHYNDDWSQLWWVRVHGLATIAAPPSAEHVAALAERYPQYRAVGVIAATIVIAADEIIGWTLEDDPRGSSAAPTRRASPRRPGSGTATS